MKIYLTIAWIALAILMSCTDNKSEKLIEGNWHAVKLENSKDSIEHHLPDGIHLSFEYPKYSFEGNESEHGNYYIKNDQLHLLPNDQDPERDLPIKKLSGDSLTLQLMDSLGIRTVHFLRNRN